MNHKQTKTKNINTIPQKNHQYHSIKQNLQINMVILKHILPASAGASGCYQHSMAHRNAITTQ